MSVPLPQSVTELATLGLRVFPGHVSRNGRCSCGGSPLCKPGKHPMLKAWQHQATNDLRRLAAWWRQWAHANPCVATGAGSGVVVIDLDGEEGLESWHPLRRRHPETVESVTGSGGAHLWFQHAGGHIGNRRLLLPGVDVRGDGGYVLAPGALHPNGRRYEWEASSHPADLGFAPLPEWLLERLLTPNTPTETAPSRPTLFVPVQPVLAACSWLAAQVTDQAAQTETGWWALLTLAARIEGGEGLAHSWSREYPGYDGPATTAKFRHAQGSLGPATCQRIRRECGGEQHCSRCVHWRNVAANPKQSPVSIASSRTAALESLMPPVSRREAARL